MNIKRFFVSAIAVASIYGNVCLAVTQLTTTQIQSKFLNVFSDTSKTGTPKDLYDNVVSVSVFNNSCLVNYPLKSNSIYTAIKVLFVNRVGKDSTYMNDLLLLLGSAKDKAFLTGQTSVEAGGASLQKGDIEYCWVLLKAEMGLN